MEKKVYWAVPRSGRAIQCYHSYPTWKAKPFTVHVDKVKPYVSNYMPKSWVTDESAVSEFKRPAVKQLNEFESSTERLESPVKQ